MKRTTFFILAFLLFFFAGADSLQAQSGCSGINFNVQIIGPCHYRLIVTNTSNCFPFLHLVLDNGAFENWQAANGWSAEQIEPAYVILTPNSGQIPTGASTPFDFFLPQGIAPTLIITWDDTCPPGKGCFAEVPLESCFIPADACITGVNYVDVECAHLPYSSQPKLSGRTITLLDAMGNTVQTTTTNATGAYSFCDLPAGNYVVKITNLPDWTSSVPASGQYAVTLEQSQTLVRNFGSCRVNCLCGSVTTIVTPATSGLNSCCYSLSTQGLNGGGFCYQFVDLQVDAGQFISPSSVPVGWTYNQINPQYIHVIPPTGFIPIGTTQAGTFCVSGASPHHITATAGFNDSGGLHECPTLFNFNCTNIVDPCPTSSPRITHTAGNPDAFSGEIDLNPGTSVVSAVWNFGDGTRDSSCCLGDISHLFEPGTYDVCLAVTTANGEGETCTSSVCVTVVVTPLSSPCDDISALLLATGTGTCCFNLDLQNAAANTFTGIDVTLSSGSFVNSPFGSGWNIGLNGSMASLTPTAGGFLATGPDIPVTICDPGGTSPYTVKVDYTYNGGVCHQTLTMDCDPANCTCLGFQNLEFYNLFNLPDMPATCGDTVDLPCIQYESDYSFQGNFYCQGNCNPALSYNIMGPNGSVLSGASVGTYFVIPNFKFLPGDYQLLLQGSCGGSSCTCIVYFTIPDCPCCSQTSADFNQTVNLATTVTQDPANCKAMMQIGNLPCQSVDWIDWGDQNISTGPFLSGTMPMHAYTHGGVYTITYQVTELNPLTGQVCYQQQFLQTIVMDCDCSCGAYTMEIRLGGAQNQPVVCGQTIQVALNQNVALYPNFQCQGAFCESSELVTWRLNGPTPTQGGSDLATPAFSVSALAPGSFSTPGLYHLYMYAVCGLQDTCWCDLYFQVADPCCTDQATFLAAAAGVQTNGILGDCTIGMEATGLTDCMRITYDWGDNQTTGPVSGNNVPVTHTYLLPGTYTVCHTIEEIDFFGNVCWNYQFCEPVLVLCGGCCGGGGDLDTISTQFVSLSAIGDQCMAAVEIGAMPPCFYVNDIQWGDGSSTSGAFGADTSIVHTYETEGPFEITYNLVQSEPGSGTVCTQRAFSGNVDPVCQIICACLGFGNLVLTPGPAGGSLNVTCGTDIVMPCQPGVTYNLTGTMPCACIGWTSVINWQLFGPQGLVDAGSTIGNPAFSIPLPSGYFYTAGTYSLVMSGNCATTCPCTIYFVISQPCPALCPCDLADFQADVAAGFSTKYYLINCKVCFKPAALGICDMVEWSVDNAPYSAAIPGTQQYCFNFSGNGTHTIQMRVTRKKGVNLICETFTFQKTITINCLPILVSTGPRTYFPWSQGPPRPLVPDQETEERSTTPEWADMTVLHIFPNPNFGTFSVDLPEPALEGMRFRLMSPTGRIVGEQTLQAGSTQQTVQAKDLPGGIYFLQLLWEGKMIAVEKFVKQ